MTTYLIYVYFMFYSNRPAQIVGVNNVNMGLYVRQNSLQFKTLVSIASPDDDQ
jgi:hypothetical protein